MKYILSHGVKKILVEKVRDLLPGGRPANARSGGIMKWWHKEGREHGPRTYRPPA